MLQLMIQHVNMSTWCLAAPTGHHQPICLAVKSVNTRQMQNTFNQAKTAYDDAQCTPNTPKPKLLGLAAEAGPLPVPQTAPLP